MVAESGLYKLITRADGASAKPFQDWVTKEVLPSIRKTGGYLLNEDMRPTAAADSREEFPMPTSFADALRNLANEVERREASERLAEELRKAREVDKPKVDFVDHFVDSSGTHSLSDAAKTIGLRSGIQLCALLRADRVLYQNARRENIAASALLAAGRFVQRTNSYSGRTAIHTRVTPLGLAWLAKRYGAQNPQGTTQ